MNVSGIRPKPGFYESAGALLEKNNAPSSKEVAHDRGTKRRKN